MSLQIDKLAVALPAKFIHFLSLIPKIVIVGHIFLWGQSSGKNNVEKKLKRAPGLPG